MRDTITLNRELGLRIRDDASSAGRWELQSGGGMVTAGIGGPLVGRGTDCLILDDPIKNAEEASSTIYREHTWEWWQTTARTRLEPDASIIIVMTRWHEDDLVGRLLKSGGEHWQHIRLPAMAEADDPLGRSEDVPLWPGRFPAHALATIREAVGPRTWAGLYQQRPTAEGGGLFSLSWWRYADSGLPKPQRIVQAWDTAYKTGQSEDRSACVTMGAMSANQWVILDVWKARVEYPELLHMVQALAAKWKPARVLVEDAASGQSIIQSLKRDTRVPVLAIKADRDKVTRANAVTGLVEAGRVVLPREAPWLADFVDEMTAFPGGAHDDQVDAFVHALTYLAKGRAAVYL